MGYFDSFANQKKSATKLIPNYRMGDAFSGVRPKEGDVGLELEVEGTSLPIPPDIPVTCPVTGGGWVSKEDGSLRGGQEYVTTSPISITSVEPLVNALFKRFAEGSRLRNSNRCSTHVHLNVSKWKVDKIISFVTFWAAIEPALIEWCGTERKKNHFCLSLQDCSATIAAFDRFLKEGSLGSFRDSLKYTTMNPLTICNYGSIEIRCGRAPDSAEDVITWTKFLHGVKMYVEESITTPAEVPELISILRPTGLIHRIAEQAGVPSFAEEVLDVCPDTDALGFESFRIAQSLCYLYPWVEWKDEIDKYVPPNPFTEQEEPARLRAAPLPRGGIEILARGTARLDQPDRQEEEDEF